MTQIKKVIVLAEPMWTKGHFETQMYLFLSILMPRNCRVIVLCAEPGKITEWVAQYMPEFQKEVYSAHFSVLDSIGRRRLKTGQIWQYLSEGVQKAEKDSGWSVDIVFITCVDVMINKGWRSLGFKARFDYPWVGLYFAPGFFRFKLINWQGIKQWVNLHIFYHIKNCKGIAILDEGTFTKIKAFFKNRDIFIFPDVTDEKLPAWLPEKIAKIKQEAGNRTVIGLVGLLQRRKGLLNYLRAMQTMDHTKCYFLIAGHLPLQDYSPEEQIEIKQLIASLNGNDYHFEFNYIEDPAEVNAYIALCDVLYLIYERFYHSSGIMTKAAVFRKPMIVTKGYCMGERVEKYRLGLTVAEENSAGITEAIRKLSDEETRQQLLSRAQFDDYLDFHNEKKLEEVLCRMLGVEY